MAGRIFDLKADRQEMPSEQLIHSGLDLARALGWAANDLHSRIIRRGSTQLDVARGSIGGEPAALFARVIERNGFDPLDSAALYAYHATVDWGVIADERGLTVFNSHWLADKGWFQLPRIDWEEVRGQTDLLDALTPNGIITGELERYASKQKAPSGFLQPVDDELVARLDNWRDQALRYARHPDQVDSRLQTLYAQLFVLRTVEDRELDPAVAPLAKITEGSEHINWDAWVDLLSSARARIGSDLFDNDVARSVPEHVFAGVVRDLYRPHGLPTSDARYDFSWIEADVLGLAYEKYLATVLQPTPPAPQQELFQSPERDVERLSVRKRSGVFYTPKFIRDYLAAECVENFFSQTKGHNPPRVIDFACGSGSFLVSAVDQILKHLKSIDSTRPWARELVQGGFIVGIDIDQNAVTTARLHLWQRLVQEPDALPLPNLSTVVIAADGLNRDTWGKLNQEYDIVLGNPPFLATSMILGREELEAKFYTAKGRYDFSYLFVEQAINVMPVGGHLGMVVPNRLYRNRNAQTARELLTQSVDLTTLVDFGSTRPFPDASAYVGCIIGKKRAPGQEPPDRVRVLEVRSVSPDFLSALLLEASRASEEISTETIHAYSARHPTSGFPWGLLSEKDQRASILFSEASARLSEIAEIWQGIRTGSNDLFIFDITSSDGSHLCRATNGLDETAVLEIELLEPVVYGSEVQRYQHVETNRRLLYPYRGNIVLPEGEIESKYPNVWAYLQRYRDLLAARSSMKQSGGKWYELVRPRDETWLRRPKLLIRDLAPKTAFALDQSGTAFIVGGSAVVPADITILLPLLAYLNSDVVNLLVRRTTPQFRGDFQKFEPQHLNAIPVLDRVYEDQDFANRLSVLASKVIAARARGSIVEALQYEAETDALIRSAASERGIQLDA